MRRSASYWLISASIFAGCGGASLSTAVAPGPHQGRLITLPGEAGFAEVVVENTKASSKSLTSEVVAYFYGPDSRTSMTPPPTDVSVQIYLAEAKTRETVALKPVEKAEGATTGARFAATPPPGFDGIIKSGRLTARLAGGNVEIPF